LPGRFKVDVVSTSVPCYLVEWYRFALTEEPLEDTAARLRECAATLAAQGSPVQLSAMLAVPGDDVLFGIFTADSAATVAQTCAQAGIPAQRVTTATSLDLTADP
jgi:hypothetical protein